VGSPFGRLVLIADPSEAGGMEAALHRIQQQLGRLGLAHQIVRAEPDGTEGAAREVLLAGDRFLVAVGGDLTVHQVVNGMIEAGRPVDPEAVLGVVTAGAPCDFVKTFGLPSDIERACGHLVVTGPTGGQVSRAFVNIAEVGLGASVTRRQRRLPRVLGRARRFVAFWATVAAFRRPQVRLVGDRRTWEGRAYDVLVANCQYQGNGMRISPKSWPDDGYLDVLVMKGPKSDAFTMLPKTYLGEHLPHPGIVEYRSRTLRVEAASRLWVHADGEVVGTTPATFEVVPKAIRLKI
jgi:YegS/Rv2252/BmrU family lipid kinase